MKKAWALSKVYINSIYGFSRIKSDLKKDAKSAFKIIGFFILILMSLSSFATMFVAFNIQFFDVLKKQNLQGLVITNSIISASIFTLIFGFLGVISTYFIDKEGDIILSMPLKPWEVFFSRFALTYIYEALTALFIMASGFIVYGVKNGEGPVFYVISILISALIPIAPMVFIYFIVVPLMRFGSIFKKKDTVMIFSGVVAIIFAVGIQFMSSYLTKFQKNPEVLSKMLTSQDGFIAVAGRIYFPSIWGSYAIVHSTSFNGLLYLLVFAVFSILCMAALLKLMSKTYIESIIGSGEVKSKNKKFTSEEFKQKLNKRSKFSTLLFREIKLMNREPVHFLNGPMVIFIMPAILGAVFYIQKGQAGLDINKLLSLPMGMYYGTLIVAALGTFLGVSTNITSSSISREGKTFMHIKSMPISPKEFILPKLVHGFIFVIIASVISCLLGLVVAKLPLINCIVAFIISILLSLPLLIIGMLIELKWPKLNWDNPTKAMKQNVNVVIITFGQMIVLVLIGFIITNVAASPLYTYLGLGFVAIILTLILYKILIGYANKRYYEIET
jgi:ABC-2 type transport system permease protein